MRSGVAVLAAGAVIALGLTGGVAEASVPVSPQSVATGSTVLLPTGDRVRLLGAAPADGVQLLPAASSGPGRTLTTRRLGDRLYVVPAVAEPYLGRALDLSLFEVTRSPRKTVQISYTGGKPEIPGVTLTSWSKGRASGFVTASSAVAFGRALTQRWQADQRAGKTTGALFGGVTKIAGSSAVPAPAALRYPMVNLNIKVIGSDGSPLPSGSIGLVDADSSARYSSLEVPIADGEGRASVPAGTYTALSNEFSQDQKTGRSRLGVATVNEYVVTAAGQTLTIDHRKDTLQPKISVPKAASVANYSFNWDRTPAVDAKRHLAATASVDGATDVFFTPVGKAKVGTVSFLQSWHLVGPGEAPAYTYDVATLTDRIPSSATKFTSSQLATVDTRYYGDGGIGPMAAVRTPTFDNPFVQLPPTYEPVARGSRRVEYVGSKGGATQWSSGVALNPGSLDDPGYIDDTPGPLAPGTKHKQVWAHGPLTGTLPLRKDKYCYACRTDSSMSFTFNPLTDTVPNHFSDVRDASKGKPTIELRAYRDGKLLKKATGVRGADIPVKKAEAKYELAYDVDRRQQAPNLSTSSQTRWTFSSASGEGAKLPTGWYCPAEPSDSCRVLPILTAQVGLPVALNGTLPTGKSTLTVNAVRLPGAAKSTVTSSTIQVRPTGGAWKSVKLTKTANGKYQGVLDNTPFAGQTVDVKVTAKDKAGSGFQQTITSAYNVPSSSPMALASATKPKPKASCPAVAPGQVRCLAVWRPIAQPKRVRNAKGKVVLEPPSEGLSPADLRAAYRLPKKGGQNQTVAVVNAYDNPNAEKDLAVYRATWKLPPCTTANGCFRKVNQRGDNKLPKPDAGWASETALDLDAVSAVCPNCKILLVEADDNEDVSLGEAENTAVRLGADVVSNSWGGPEDKKTGALRKKYFNHPRVPILAASGDSGFIDTIYPAAFSNVWAVGGTSLIKAAKTGWTETAWSGAGSGCSAWIAKPAWQKDTHCAYRTVSDVSAVADPETGLAVYDTYGENYNGWTAIGGTSLATPLVAGMIGLAGNAEKVASPKYAYTHRSGLHDVVGGSNGDDCGGDYLCTAVKGYDAPTGLGSPRGLGAL